MSTEDGAPLTALTLIRRADRMSPVALQVALASLEHTSRQHVATVLLSATTLPSDVAHTILGLDIVRYVAADVAGASYRRVRDLGGVTRGWQVETINRLVTHGTLDVLLPMPVEWLRDLRNPWDLETVLDVLAAGAARTAAAALERRWKGTLGDLVRAAELTCSSTRS